MNTDSPLWIFAKRRRKSRRLCELTVAACSNVQCLVVDVVLAFKPIIRRQVAFHQEVCIAMVGTACQCILLVQHQCLSIHQDVAFSLNAAAHRIVNRFGATTSISCLLRQSRFFQLVALQSFFPQQNLRFNGGFFSIFSSLNSFTPFGFNSLFIIIDNLQASIRLKAASEYVVSDGHCKTCQPLGIIVQK